MTSHLQGATGIKSPCRANTLAIAKVLTGVILTGLVLTRLTLSPVNAAELPEKQTLQRTPAAQTQSLTLTAMELRPADKWHREFGVWQLVPVPEGTIEAHFSAWPEAIQYVQEGTYIRNDLGVSNYYVVWRPSATLVELLKQMNDKTDSASGEPEGPQLVLADILAVYGKQLEQDSSLPESIGESFHLASMLDKQIGVPRVTFHVQNQTEAAVVLKGLSAEPLYYLDADCGSWLDPIPLTDSDRSIEISWQKRSGFRFDPLLTVGGGEAVEVSIDLHVIDDGPNTGECSGPLTYNLFLDYLLDDEPHRKPLATFTQEEENDGLMIFELDPEYL
uniref:hypothetical protein n=1 Tax=Thaumasiovibrio occultus TaxID=1891184 RepID=UPI000B353B1F|nr:hypothetical protein [Thaumasiovibrio occultus]